MSNCIKFFLALLSGIAVSACNTTSGLGQDIEAAGAAIEETAEEAKDELDDG